ncbi:SGNH/GDSL hydrolase family protein [Bacillus sp. B190/17]|uniref:SGNH/GDSL hydrolase family protein n=1 Tax=Bacillus lumedeiriae TaxID=3058829 RepID=A0ABW8IC69_9BACI
MKGLFVKIILGLCIVLTLSSMFERSYAEGAGFSRSYDQAQWLNGPLYEAAETSVRYKYRAAYIAAGYFQAVKRVMMPIDHQNGLILAFGDSNTQGANWQANGYDVKDKWVNKLAQSQAVINAGIGGNTTEHGRIRFEKDVLSKHPQIVLIMFGTNDAALDDNGQPQVSKAQYEENINYFVDTLQGRGIDVILMTTIPVIERYYYSRNDGNLYSPYGSARRWHDSYNMIVRKIAKEKHVLLVDHYRNITEPMRGVNDQKLIDSGLIDASGTHFTPKGAAFIYRRIHLAVQCLSIFNSGIN